MTDERFNEHQIEVLRKCFAIVTDTVTESYREKVEKNVAESVYESAPAFWGMLPESVKDFEGLCEKILSNDLESVDSEQFQEVMFLVEVLEHEAAHTDLQKAQTLRSGLTLLVGMFRNQFPGEQWNPDNVRWTTIGEAETRGISPMLMAIAEL